MLKAYPTSRFRKDYKRGIKRYGNKIRLLDEILVMLQKEIKLAKSYKDHSLKGDLKERRECHILPDLLLIYRYAIDHNGDRAIYFERLGSHSDLF